MMIVILKISTTVVSDKISNPEGLWYLVFRLGILSIFREIVKKLEYNKIHKKNTVDKFTLIDVNTKTLLDSKPNSNRKKHSIPW